MLAGHENLKKLRFKFSVSVIFSVVTCACTVPIYIDSNSLGSQNSSQHCNNSWTGLYSCTQSLVKRVHLL